MKKIVVNDKPMSKEKVTIEKESKRLANKFPTQEDLLKYIEALEARIEQLEKQQKIEKVENK